MRRGGGGHRLGPMVLLPAVVVLALACGGGEGPTSTVPEPEPDPIRFTQVAAGEAHACALTEGGDVYCWGAFGLAGIDDPLVPNRVDLPVTARGLQAADRSTCVLDGGGEAYCWGNNSSGQLAADPTLHTLPEPTRMATEVAFEEIELSDRNACGRTGTGEVYCWGYGEVSVVPGANWETCANGACSAEPRRVALSASAVDVTLGVEHACALGSDGVTVCWGENRFHQLGSSGLDRSVEPVAIQGGRRFDAIEGGPFLTCGREAEGTLACWGTGWAGAMGQPEAMDTSSAVPLVVEGIAASALGFRNEYPTWTHLCALDVEGGAYCWGAEFFQSLGSDLAEEVCTVGNWGPFACSATPLPVDGGLRFRDLDIGYGFGCGVADDGWVYCWGFNDDGRLGDGTETHRAAPVPIAEPER